MSHELAEGKSELLTEGHPRETAETIASLQQQVHGLQQQLHDERRLVMAAVSSALAVLRVGGWSVQGCASWVGLSTHEIVDAATFDDGFSGSKVIVLDTDEKNREVHAKKVRKNAEIVREHADGFSGAKVIVLETAVVEEKNPEVQANKVRKAAEIVREHMPFFGAPVWVNKP